MDDSDPPTRDRSADGAPRAARHRAVDVHRSRTTRYETALAEARGCARSDCPALAELAPTDAADGEHHRRATYSRNARQADKKPPHDSGSVPAGELSACPDRGVDHSRSGARADAVARYLAGRPGTRGTRLSPRGTPFRQSVAGRGSRGS